MTTQSEYALEQGLVAQLERMEYTGVRIDDEADMLAPTSNANWKSITMVLS